MYYQKINSFLIIVLRLHKAETLQTIIVFFGRNTAYKLAFATKIEKIL